MFKRKLIQLTPDERSSSPFAWPFKVIRDLFNSRPSVPEPDFEPLNLSALRGKGIRLPGYSRSALVRLNRTQLTFLVWIFELIVLPLLLLLIFF